MRTHKYCLRISWKSDPTKTHEFFFCVDEGDVFDSLWKKFPNDRQKAINEYARGLAKEFLARGSVLLPKHGEFDVIGFFHVVGYKNLDYAEQGHENGGYELEYFMRELERIDC